MEICHRALLLAHSICFTDRRVWGHLFFPKLISWFQSSLGKDSYFG